MIISEGTFNCFLSTPSDVAKTPSEDCQLSQIYSSVGRDHGWDHGGDGKVFNPSSYPYCHLHIQRITEWPDCCWAQAECCGKNCAGILRIVCANMRCR